jgi:hypothetical protein
MEWLAHHENPVYEHKREWNKTDCSGSIWLVHKLAGFDYEFSATATFADNKSFKEVTSVPKSGAIALWYNAKGSKSGNSWNHMGMINPGKGEWAPVKNPKTRNVINMMNSGLYYGPQSWYYQNSDSAKSLLQTSMKYFIWKDK